MRSTASSVRASRRIGMVVRRLLIWGARVPICFIRRRILGIIERQRILDVQGMGDWFLGGLELLAFWGDSIRLVLLNCGGALPEMDCLFVCSNWNNWNKPYLDCKNVPVQRVFPGAGMRPIQYHTGDNKPRP